MNVKNLLFQNSRYAVYFLKPLVFNDVQQKNILIRYYNTFPENAKKIKCLHFLKICGVLKRRYTFFS